MLAALSASRRRRRAGRRLSSAAELSRETGLPLLIEAPARLLGDPAAQPEGWPSISRGRLEAARKIDLRLREMAGGDRPKSVFIHDGIDQSAGIAPAVALATESALQGRRTLLVDCDFKHRRLAAGLGLQASPGIGDYLNCGAAPPDLLQALEMRGRAVKGVNGHSPGRLVFIAAGNGSTAPMPAFTWERFRHFVAKATRAYEFVVIVGEPLLATSQPSQLVALADVAVVCARPAAVTRGQASEAAAALGRWFPRTAGLVVAIDPAASVQP